MEIFIFILLLEVQVQMEEFYYLILLADGFILLKYELATTQYVYVERWSTKCFLGSDTLNYGTSAFNINLLVTDSKL